MTIRPAYPAWPYPPRRAAQVVADALGFATLTGAALGGGLGTLLFPIIGTLFGGFVGACVGLALGVVNACALVVMRPCSDEPWTARLTVGMTSAAGAALLGAASHLPSVWVAGFAGVCAVIGAPLGPRVAFGRQPVPGSTDPAASWYWIDGYWSGGQWIDGHWTHPYWTHPYWAHPYRTHPYWTHPDGAWQPGGDPRALSGRAADAPAGGWRRDLTMLNRLAFAGAAGGVIVGTVCGAAIGLRGYPPTAVFAVVEGGLLGIAPGGVLGALVAGVVAAVTSLRRRRR